MENVVNESTLIKELKSQSTWRLFGLSFITYGVYFAYYIAKQTEIINKRVDENSKISPIFVKAIFIASYASLFLFFAYCAVEEGHPIEIISNVADRIWQILVLVWSFQARNRINRNICANPGDANWFHGFWTFLFTALYINYKVNFLNADSYESDIVA